MKINRRDERLDDMLGKKVQIEFTDGTFASGVLHWNERFTPETPYHSQMYLLERVTGGVLEFRKGHVNHIEEIRRGNEKI